MQRRKAIVAGVGASVLAAGVLAPQYAASGAPEHLATHAFAALSAAQAKTLSGGTQNPVIVLLKDQPAQPHSRAARAARLARITTAQTPLRHELARVHAGHVRRFGLVNAVAATMSKAESARLATDPAVAQVIPDSLVRGAAPNGATTGAELGAPDGVSTSGPQQICPARGKTMLEPEALDVTHTDSDDPSAKTARSLGYTGAGVKVGYIAEGIDTDNPDFIRADGSHVFADYQDFTGEGTDAPTSGGEAFLDASAIAAQGLVTHDVSHYSAHPTSKACNIHIEGVAPGASLYGFKVFGDSSYSTTSAILQSINWAVTVDHVDVLNESFGYNPFPDTTSLDAVKQFDSAAVAAGTTLTVSSGDAGTNSTEGSPSTDPDVISVGASTTFRWYEQADYAVSRQFGKSGWLNDNVSSLSSSGFTQSGHGIDLLAPGDGSFAACTPNTDRYEDCVNFAGQPSDVERSGGTSESAPLTAGAAALVIQAYRGAHGGASPTPALIRRILTSTADDLTVPGDEQGAGLLDTYKAVQAAASVHDANGTPARTGSTLLVSRGQLNATAAPGTTRSWPVTVTNTGAAAQTVRLSGRSFGPATHQVRRTIVLTDSAPRLRDWSGVKTDFQKFTFPVAANQQRLDAEISYPGDPTASLNARVRLILIDPLGRFAAHSLPQGVGNYGHVDVRFPTAGTWTAVILSRIPAVGGTVGTVHFAASTSQTVPFGSVSPSTITLAPGASTKIMVSATTPAHPGDASGSVVLNAGAGGQTSIPVLLRSLLPLVSGSGSARFAGVLTGGNGRQPDIGQGNFYEMDVPNGQHDLSASVSLASDPGDTVVAFLIDPHGYSQAIGTNKLATSLNPTTRDADLTSGLSTDLYVRRPMAGRWTLVVNFAGAVVGDQLAVPFSGRVALNSVRVDGSAVPTRGSLATGKAVTVPVTIHNTGKSPQDYFVDARTNAEVSYDLAAVEPAQVPLPIPGDAPTPAWLVPSDTSGVAIVGDTGTSTGDGPQAMFDFGPEAGDPDLVSTSSDLPAGFAGADRLPSGLWAADPSLVGPSGAAGLPAASIILRAAVQTKGFDDAVSTPAGDLWRTSVAPSANLPLITVQPGRTVTIPVTITPSAAVGSTVRGMLEVDQLVVGPEAALNAINFSDPGATEVNANTIASIPYKYRVTR